MKKSWTNGRTKRIHVPSPYKPRAYKLCGCLGGGILVENSSPDCCPLSCLVDVALDEFLDIHLTVLVLGILFALLLLACLLAPLYMVISIMMNVLFTLFELDASVLWQWTFTQKSDLMRWVAPEESLCPELNHVADLSKPDLVAMFWSWRSRLHYPWMPLLTRTINHLGFDSSQ